jgi:exopolysaccharide production protein ExoY
MPHDIQENRWITLSHACGAVPSGRATSACLARPEEITRAPQNEFPLSSLTSQFQAGHNPLPVWKRTLDLVLLFLVAPAAIPLMALTALVVRMFSGSSVLFRQERMGFYGRPFVCLKFRTMYVAETAPHEMHLAAVMASGRPMTKLDLTDKRIIPFGMFLRATGLDELPQLFNILRGEMSFVGPRPCLRYEYERFGEADMRRFEALPGLTGLWQVSGKNNTTFQEMIRLDVEYARTLSFRREIRILLLTFPVLFSQTFIVVRNKWQRLMKARRRSELCS